MKRLPLVAMFLAGIVAVQLAPAQQFTRPAATVAAAPQAAASWPIALIDISAIFKNHVRFKQMMAQMEEDVKRAEQEVKAEQESIRAAAQKLDQWKKGSQEYKALEEELATKSSALSVRVNLQKKEFLQKEAAIYHTVYQEVLRVVQYHAQKNGTQVVLRFNGDTVDAQNPEEVLRDINRAVVWYASGLNMTDVVLADLNRGASAAPAASTGVPGARVPVQGSLPAPMKR